MKKLNEISIKYVLCFFIVVFICSCKKSTWYDVKSSSTTVVPSTLADMQAIMDFTGTLNAYDPVLGEAGSDGHYSSPKILLTLTQNSRNAYTWSNLIPYRDVNDWNFVGTQGAYPKIFYCNVVLEGLTKIKPNTQDEVDQWNYVKGQALFFRAKSFFDISQIFAPPYISNTASIDPGIPLRLDPDPSLISKRSSLKQTYEQIIGDLTLAKDLLSKNISPSGGALQKMRPCQVAVYAMLARVYISMEYYNEAWDNANSALQLYNTLLDYNNINDYKATATRPIMSFNSEVIFQSTMIIDGTVSLSNSLIDPQLYALFEPDDWRKAGNFQITASTGDILFKATYSGNTFLFSGLTTGELYLIRAECFARKNNYQEAMNDLNTLLLKRYKSPFVPKIAVDANDALSKILTERRKELILRGLRWSDLRRLNRDDRFKITQIRVLDGKEYKLEPGSFKYTFPIPQNVIEVTGMQQNKGWE